MSSWTRITPCAGPPAEASRATRWRTTGAPQKASDYRGDPIDEYRDPTLVRMKPIGLIEFWFHRHTLEKERIERQMMDARKLREDLIEGMPVLLSPIWRGEHAEKQHFRAASLDFSNHLVEILADI